MTRAIAFIVCIGIAFTFGRGVTETAVFHAKHEAKGASKW